MKVLKRKYIREEAKKLKIDNAILKMRLGMFGILKIELFLKEVKGVPLIMERMRFYI